MRRILLILSLFVAASLSAQVKPYHGDGPDDVLQYAPYGTVFLLKALGVESESTWKRMAVNVGASYVLSAGITYVLKHTVKENRPDGTDNRSFPSGHSAFAFAGAHALHKEYGRVSPWVGVAGYAVAAFTAVDRVCRNRHHWYDVVSGAAIGVLSTEAAYWLGDKLTGEHARYSVGLSPTGVAVSIGI